MTLDEAIKHAEEVAEEHTEYYASCDKYAEKYRQLAEWLKELKQLRADRDRLLDAFDKIRAEIERAADKQFEIAIGVTDLNERYTHIQMEKAYRHSLNIIDEYKAEVEP